jgi:cytidine deaminase
LLTDDGELYCGVNVENASFGASNCAERTAIYKAISEGKKKFSAIAIASDLDAPILPCGICRQVFAEFTGDDFKVICCGKNGDIQQYTMKELLPQAFKKFKNYKKD